MFGQEKRRVVREGNGDRSKTVQSRRFGQLFVVA